MREFWEIWGSVQLQLSKSKTWLNISTWHCWQLLLNKMLTSGIPNLGSDKMSTGFNLRIRYSVYHIASEKDELHCKALARFQHKNICCFRRVILTTLLETFSFLHKYLRFYFWICKHTLIFSRNRVCNSCVDISFAQFGAKMRLSSNFKNRKLNVFFGPVQRCQLVVRIWSRSDLSFGRYCDLFILAPKCVRKFVFFKKR